MISPLLDPSRKPPNALRGLRRKMAHFIPSAGVHTNSYNLTTTRFLRTVKECVDGLRGGWSSNPVAIGSAVRGRLRRSSCPAATIGDTALRRNPLRSFAGKVLLAGIH